MNASEWRDTVQLASLTDLFERGQASEAAVILVS
jgi:hypothetical protein